MGFSATLRVKGLDKVIEKIKQLEEKFIPELQSVVIDSTQLCLKAAVELAPHKTGRLARSIKARFEDNNLTGIVHTNVVYAPIQEFGGIIQARRVKNLTIPLNREAELTTARKLIESGQGVIFKSKKGNLILWKKIGKKIIPMYLLKPSVRIRPHPYMRPALGSVKDIYIDKIRQILTELVK